MKPLNLLGRFCLLVCRTSVWRPIPRDGICALVILLLAALWAFGPASRALAQSTGPAGSDRIFAAQSLNPPGPIFEITGGQRVEFARITTCCWIGPLASPGDSRLFVVSNANNGSLWEITDGGDLTSAPPVASNLFPMGVGFLEGLAFDAEGNAYVANAERGLQQIAVVDPDGSISYLPDRFDNPLGLAVQDEVLYIAEGNTGRVLAYDLASGEATPFATGFTRGGGSMAGQLAVDPRGRLLLLWSAGMGFGLFDITDGGDFAGRTPLVPAPFRIDVNQIAVDSANNVYAAGDMGGIVYVSQLDGEDFTPFEPFATGLGDTESVAVLLP